VRLQKLDSGDRLTEVVLVPPAPEEEETEAKEVTEAKEEAAVSTEE
jgi:DNA gyrase subunit A